MGLSDVAEIVRKLGAVAPGADLEEHLAEPPHPHWFSLNLAGSAVLAFLDGPERPVRICAGVAVAEVDQPGLVEAVARYANRWEAGGAYIYFGMGAWLVTLRVAVHPQLIDLEHQPIVSWFVGANLTGLGQTATWFREELTAQGIALRAPDTTDVLISTLED